MALVSSLHLHSFLRHPSHGRSRIFNIVCFKNNERDTKYTPSVCVGKEFGTKRRELLFQAVSAVVAFPALTSVALADSGIEVVEDFRVYTDEANKFKITIPQDWVVGTGEGDGVRSLIAFYPQITANSNVSIAITSLGADFTRLESFGKVDAFAENLIGGLDRSWQRPPGVAAKLIDCKAANGMHGGAVGAVAERLAIACARTVVGKDKNLFLGELSISYLSAAPRNTEVIVDGSVVRSGRNLTVVAVEFRHKESGRLAFIARATFYNMPIARL